MFRVYYVVFLFPFNMVSHSFSSLLLSPFSSIASLYRMHKSGTPCVSVSEFAFECIVCVNIRACNMCRSVSFNNFECSFIEETGFGFYSRPQLLRCVTNESKRISMSIVLPNKSVNRQHSKFYSNSILLYFDVNACLRYDNALRFLFIEN